MADNPQNTANEDEPPLMLDRRGRLMLGHETPRYKRLMANPQTTILSRQELIALEDISKSGGRYIWKQASMRKLEVRGFVVHDGEDIYGDPAWRITEAGLEHLKGFPK